MALRLLERGERSIRNALELCTIYHGNIQNCGQGVCTTKLFSLRHDDLRLSNIMIDESGNVTGIIDFEGATISPLWECALLPRWLQDLDDPEGMYEGGSLECRQTLRTRFLDKIGDGEWRTVYESGRPYRLLGDHLFWQIAVWADRGMEQWVNERLSWAKDHPGVGFPEHVGVAAYSVRPSSPPL
ncbi:hypothetical protein BYT27DRAFT_7086344 [Phlegmacium glaucopus]|nr:hypothetical protein BYT27DRAFT_7086344 [Phlegmacium glaucopus]